MASLVILFLAACAVPALAEDRIVGGSPTTIDRYPSIVQVDYRNVNTGNWGQSCAANIISNRYVLSAAHCFAGGNYNPNNRRIRAGSSNRNTGGTIAYVDVEFNHPSYGQNRLDGDISVVRLRDNLVFSPVIAQGPIISQGAQLPDNSPVVHSGWGATSQGGPASSVLLDVTIYTVNNDLCRQRYQAVGSVVTENMICAGLLDVGGADACQGDSGGPLYYEDTNAGNVIVGVVSWGRGCAQAQFPGVSTAVSSYTNWIVATAV